MAPIRLCAAGNATAGEHGEAGFTLTELLVVLAIIGLLMAAIPVLLQSAVPGTRSLAAARALAGDLRSVRGQAVAVGAVTGVRFDAAKQTYVLEPGERARSLPNGIHFSLPAGRASQQTQIGFFPDGSSNGGVVLVGDGALKHRVAVDWLTGRVAIDE